MRMQRMILIAAVVGMMLAACGDSPASDSSPSTTQPPVLSSSTTSTTAVPPTTAPSTLPPENSTPEPVAIDRLDNGLPATFVAVTESWEAVEVDTSTGDIVRSIGRSQTPANAEEEEMVHSAVQQVWRAPDRSWFVIAECCEPAAGTLYYLTEDQVLTPQNRFDLDLWFGWTASPSPFDETFAHTGYNIMVGVPGETPEVNFFVDQAGPVGFPSGVIAWDRSGGGIAWLSNSFTEENSSMLNHLSLDEPDTAPTSRMLEWVGPDQWLDGLGTQESGNHVAFLHTVAPDTESGEIIASEGVVFDAAGELIASFSVETGARWGGYDPSGRFLIYTDADNVVRWQGRGQAGVLGSGFIHASW